MYSYLPPSAFDHSVSSQGTPNGWNNLKCAYEWKSASSAASISFTSPVGCLHDSWTQAHGEISNDLDKGVQVLTLTFDTKPKPKVLRGFVSEDCTMIDMEDGGLYTRGPHPIDQSDHEWLRTATGWLMRAAQIKYCAFESPIYLTNQWCAAGSTTVMANGSGARVPIRRLVGQSLHIMR